MSDDIHKDENVLIWEMPQYFPNKNIVEFSKSDHNVSSLIFMQGRALPFQSIYEHYADTLRDPGSYNLRLISENNIKKTSAYDCLPNNMHGMPPVVNKRTLDILTDFCPNDIQYFPILIECQGGKESDARFLDYFLINIITKVSAIDADTSYVRYNEGGRSVSNIKKLFLQQDAMVSCHLAREEAFLPLKLVSRELANILVQEKITGVGFYRPLEIYNDPFPDEYLVETYPNNPEAAKRSFVTQLNTTEYYEFFKTRVHLLPREIIEGLIEMTLSRSSFHAEQCAELLSIYNKAVPNNIKEKE